ncbi:FAD-dependent oxidoreductase [Pontiella sulfatireligans]|uniref:Assimilatory nitrate reductase electron transfer subunit n=1 Tax=Pontiella sulfatireligans TaxID=2750658 RepID=A0A6C2UPZ6_9BACT|nr:FAD-dependent oxidoreductase [Pontiella sulfatireligans]VGO22003.1 Assimilatory nitrate reductase electron transfer subunit [Pontiella sulfatireligans]
MQQNTEKTWRCAICGYIHYGDSAPEPCPICDAKAEDFEHIDAPQRPVRRDVGQERVVIVGAGVAGVSAAEAVRKHAPDAEIILISQEEEFPYMRLNLTRLLAGEFAEKNLPLHSPEWYGEQRIKLLRGHAAARLVLAEKAVQLDNGETLQFDKLIVATGSHPFMPPIPGSALQQVFTVRTVEDVRQILSVVQPETEVVCIGGGILGLETAGALAKQQANVTVLEAFEYLMPLQLNAEGSRVLEEHLNTLSIKVITNASADCIIGDGHVTGVHLKRGQLIPASVVVVAAGDRANAELLEQAGLTVKKGALVDNFLRTAHPDIYAVGDVAEHDGVRYGSWSPAMYMGKIAGMNAAGAPTEFGGIPRSHLLKVLGKPMLSIGTIIPTDGSYRMIEDHADNGYRLFMFRDGRLTGCLLIGKLKLMKPVRKALQARLDMKELLTPETTAEEVAAHLAGL